MLEFARKEGLYENYFVEYLTENELPIPPGKTKKKKKKKKKIIIIIIIIIHTLLCV